MEFVFTTNLVGIYRIIVLIFLILNIGLAGIIIFLDRDRRTATSTWVWLLLLFIVPIFGFILYLFFGRSVKFKKTDDGHSTEIEDAKNRVKKQRELFRNNNFDSENSVVRKHASLVNTLLTREVSFMTEDNEVSVYTDGHELFDQFKKDLRNAKNYIHLEFYTINNDNLGKEIIHILEEKVKEGLEVKILCDSIGSKKLHKSNLKRFKELGGEAQAFFKGNIPFLNFRANYRNHRKILVIDGEIGYVGGFNIGDEYLGLNKKLGYWRDTHISVTGDGVDSLELNFIQDWNSQVNEDKQLGFDKKYFPENKHKKGEVAMQLAVSGPDDNWQQIEFGYQKMIMNAKESIYIQTPYFVPNQGYINALRIAHSAGVDINIIIPNKPDQPLVHWATLSSLQVLIYSGVNVYTYEKGFIHSKMMVVDGEVSSVGSCNMDIRSFELNFEVNAFIYNKDIASQLVQAFKEDVKNSKRLTVERYEQRSNWVKFKQSISKLASPIL